MHSLVVTLEPKEMNSRDACVVIADLESWLCRHGLEVAGWKLVPLPDPNEEHSGVDTA